jgi:hypothetical protein
VWRCSSHRIGARSARAQGSRKIKAKPKGIKRVSRVKARRQLGKEPSERDAKDFIVAAIEASLKETLEQLRFSDREVKDLQSAASPIANAAPKFDLT